jgi:hypothetical protein
MSNTVQEQPDNTMQGSLFDNPAFQEMMKKMKPEELAEYKRMGEYMYSRDYEKKRMNEVVPPTNRDIIIYIREGLKSGLHPRDLSEKEIQIMWDEEGKEWYKEFGYTEDEVPKPTFSIEGEPKPNRKLTKEERNHCKKMARKELKKANKGVSGKKLVSRAKARDAFNEAISRED